MEENMEEITILQAALSEAKLQAALSETERMWREEKRRAEYYRKLAAERWRKLQEVKRVGCRD
jgi:hypothetical protein